MAADAAFARWRQRVEAGLDAQLPAAAAPQRLHAAMRHATLGGGKRMRPLLVYASGALFGADEARLDTPALAVELIHAYSLVHDDLPAMDDDTLRRGRPTVHVVFGEATAILAGDALQSLAFELLASAGSADAALRVRWLQTLAEAAGAAGMCGGQALDIDATGAVQPLAELQRMHALKTGALIRASVRLGALGGGADAAAQAQLDAFATALGLAFQVRDDILDVEASSEQLGKTAGKDAAHAKSTYPALLGMDGAKAKLGELADAMRAGLHGHGARADALAALARLAVDRSH
ncbi:polyprenyl synthetase family protein [Xanthomonas theicola]|uniref:Geranyl transferase n=1 Tax=Xanthomonas theicola TaxID=56464 RepID=A0A2S6ZKY2_9XANT|nr:farnesyl diphosphate synthase [Xanthomonas theicola]PPT92931.1 geranyl transferase [Xanthomonas theicola]QNH23742.1 geranyl transferase [Xanthomonas theicola]